MSFDYPAFIDQHLFVMYLGVLLTGMGIVLFEFYNKKFFPVLFIVLGAFTLRLFVVLIDPFLHMWDEQVHALVAKNLINNPFKPVLLKDPILYYNFKDWAENHIWLHKQPLFLWQMALSIKLFGLNEFAVRFPSLLMSGIIVWFIYRIGSIVSSKGAGFYGAVLFAGSSYLIELTAGRMHTDHNDIAFLFYITASLWAWFEYSKSRKIYWIILIGVLAGMAILVKWLTGLLVYSGWFVVIISNSNWRYDRRRYFDILKSLAVTAITVLPWQIYILTRFPKESNFEYTFNSRHFFEALEGHDGTWFYHFKMIEEIYGFYFNYVILASILIFIIIKINRNYKFAITTWILVVYLFFTLAATKMIGFTIIVIPLVYILVGIAVDYLINLVKKRANSRKRTIIVIQLLTISLIFFSFLYFIKLDTLSHKDKVERKKLYEKKIKIAQFYKELPAFFLEDEIFIFNTMPYDHIKIMFYTDFRSRSFIPTEKQIKKLKNYPIKIVVFDNGKLPDHILNDKDIAKVISPAWMSIYQGETDIYY